MAKGSGSSRVPTRTSSRLASRWENQPPNDSSTNNEPNAESLASTSATIIRSDMATWQPAGRPRYFAQRRTDFAAATKWFNTLQTAFCSTNKDDPRNGGFDAQGNEVKYCTGMYIAGCPPTGRYVDAEVIITSINGPENTAKHVGDREREMRNSLERRVPVGVAVGKDAARPDAGGVQTLPCGIPGGLECVVLGWFVVSHMWPKPGRNARGEDKVVWMVRLEKIFLGEQSWWANAAHRHPGLEERDFTTKAVEETCLTCGEDSVRLFKPHFVCLNQNCREWFRANGENAEADPANLIYHTRFLAERRDSRDESLAPWEDFWPFYPDLYPTFEQFRAKNYPDGQGPQPSVTKDNLAERNEALTTGFACPQCGLANSRVDYHRWHCRNTDCRDAAGNVNPFSYHAPPATVTPELLEEARSARGQDTPLRDLFGYRATVDLASHILHEFAFGERMRMGLFRCKPHSKPGCKPGSKDDTPALEMSDRLFRAVQRLAASGGLGLARRTVSANGGTGLTNHYVENYGKRYKLPFALGDIPFHRAPEEVRDALALANNLMWEYFGGPRSYAEFNEMYIAAYLDKTMGMNYHDDGEKNLGPVIATWTLGGDATFKLCIKPQFDFGRKKKGGKWLMNPQKDGGPVDPVPAGCTEEGPRKALRARFRRGEITSAEWAAQLEEHMDAHMAGNEIAYTKRPLVSFTVRHGDVVVMWGADTQRLMEHAVECRSPMRFAVTMRRVTGDMGTAAQWAVLDRRLLSDRAFTPAWAKGKEVEGKGKKREREAQAEEVEGEGEVGKSEAESEGKPAGTRVTRSMVKRARKQ